MNGAEYSCAWCGGEYYADELDDDLVEVDGEYKCKTCIVEECDHRSTWKEYISSNSQGAKFVEHCTSCSSWRVYRFYFDQKQARFVDAWRHDEVDV